MPELSRSQLLVYGAIAIVLLLVGVRWIGSSQSSSVPADAGGITVDAGAGVERGGGARLVVHVAGAVRDPGIYRLPETARVADAVERAGGATGDGAFDAINLAARLADGQQVVVPERGAGADSSAVSAAAGGPISLGSATVEQLETIDGIGPVTAEKIIEFRDQQGGVGSIEELDEISGIGPVTIESLRDSLQP